LKSKDLIIILFFENIIFKWDEQNKETHHRRPKLSFTLTNKAM